MAMMLRQKGTGDIYIYTSALAARDDMEVFESEPAPPPVAPVPAKLKATATSTTKVLPPGDEP